MIKLSKANLPVIWKVDKPDDTVFQLPEKVLQFGTGVLLRGLPDYFIDKANKQGIFNGRIVVVKSTLQNNTDEFAIQDGLYTTCIRGWKNNTVQSFNYLNASISRVINANTGWADVLACAENPEMKIVISNTTELGIVLDEKDKINTGIVPASFPGKLLEFLYRRYRYFNGDRAAGMIIIPTELIPDNGTALKEICRELANIHRLEDDFIQWLDHANEFCDSLVDRIVPGKVALPEAEEIFRSLGYEDDLMIMSESYALWAIQAKDPAAKETLSFHKVDAGVIITGNIEKYRTLKLYLLNASHTFSCIIALTSGFSYVNEAMSDSGFEQRIKTLLADEAIRAIESGQIALEEARQFAEDVLDRFRNPFIKHKWSDIAKQTTLKMRMRCVPLIKMYKEKLGQLPPLMIKGFAHYMLFMKTHKDAHGNYITTADGKDFIVEDAKAGILFDHWQGANTDEVVRAVLSDTALWNEDLTLIKDLAASLAEQIDLLINVSLEKI